MSDAYASPAEIIGIVENLNKVAANFQEIASSNEDDKIARQKLKHEAYKLLSSLEEPNGEVWTRTFQVNVSAAVEVMAQLNLWDKFEGDRSVPYEELVTATEADEIIVIRILRQLTAAHLLIETLSSRGTTFRVSALGRPYLNPDHRAFNNFMFYDMIPTIMAMPKALAERGYKTPTKATGTPFEWANGKELWTWMGAHPDRAKNMVAAMKSHNSLDAYPWGLELGKLNLTDQDIAVVDIAGGQGHIMSEVRRKNPDLKGRLIVQDLPSTFEAFPTPPEGVEFMGYDIFTPQPVTGAAYYHYRHIFHNWSDDDCTTILAQLVPVLRAQPKSRLLVVDVVLPDCDASMQQAVMDISMYPLGGLERTESQWRELFARSNFHVRRIWRGSEPEACIECVLVE